MKYIKVEEEIYIIIIIIIIIIIKSRWHHGVLGLTLTIRPYHPSLLAVLYGCILCQHGTDVRFCRSTITGTSSPWGNIAYEFVPASPAVSCISCSSNFNGLWDGRHVAVLLLLCRLLLSGIFKTACSFLELFLPSLFSLHFVGIHMVHPYINMDTATAWKKSRFISLDRSCFRMIDELSIGFYAFFRRMMTSLSEDEVLLPKYRVTKKKKKKKKTELIYFWLKFINLILAFSFFFRIWSRFCAWKIGTIVFNNMSRSSIVQN